ncbi:nucleotidyltransferase domain-containing protein [Pseudomonas syringae]|nr:nucleotidyltransferase domain-containing protein [Pseudomonas syringae]
MRSVGGIKQYQPLMLSTSNAVLDVLDRNVMSYLEKNVLQEARLACEAIFVGGSYAKGYFDQYSDIDLTLVVRHPESVLPLCCQTFSAVQYGYHAVEDSEADNVDLRVMDFDYLIELIRNFSIAKDIRSSHLDTLCNVKHGVYLYESVAHEEQRTKIIFDMTHCVNVMRRYKDAIFIPCVRKYFERNHFYAVFETLGLSYAAFCHIFYAVNGSLFQGYSKLERHAHDFKIYPSSIIALYRHCYADPCVNVFEELNDALHGFIRSIESHLS